MSVTARVEHELAGAVAVSGSTLIRITQPLSRQGSPARAEAALRCHGEIRGSSSNNSKSAAAPQSASAGREANPSPILRRCIPKLADLTNR